MEGGVVYKYLSQWRSSAPQRRREVGKGFKEGKEGREAWKRGRKERVHGSMAFRAFLGGGVNFYRACLPLYSVLRKPFYGIE